MKFRISPGETKKRAALFEFFKAQEDKLGAPNVVDPMALTPYSSAFQQGIAKIRAYLVSQLMTTPIFVGFDNGKRFTQQEAQEATASVEKLDEGVECALAAND